MTTPRRADARRGFLFRFNPLPSHALQGWQGGTCCGMLDSMILYNRPRRRDEVADFVAASSGDYTFLRLCGLRCAAAYLYPSAHRAHKHAHQLTRGRADARRSAEDAEGKDEQAARTRGSTQGTSRGASRRRGERRGAGARLHRATMCAGAGGCYDIGRDGTGSGSQLRTRSGGRDAVGRTYIGRIGGDYAADYDAGAV